MGTYKFSCTLLSDIIISQNAATKSEQKTLDFIPGSNFLGIAAGKLYDDLRKKGLSNLVFHSGKVRFGDAHPASDNFRSLRVPAAMYYPKVMSPTELCYIHHLYDRSKDTSDNGHPAQLVQCRNDFYVFNGNAGKKVRINKSFSLKSAYDRAARRSENKKMYGYEALRKGSVLFFEIDIDTVEADMENDIIDNLKPALEGRRHIGRSRTAQYGLVSIKYLKPADEYEEVNSSGKTGEFATVYADGRLIFTDSYGLPKILPDATDLGFGNDAEILWDKSQIRTFQFAPWNNKRKSRDSDRCGIEKGSVLVVKCSSSPEKSDYVGSYTAEGFGKVIYNPDFLSSSGQNGMAKYRLTEGAECRETPQDDSAIVNGNYLPLFTYLERRKSEDENLYKIYDLVNKFVKKNSAVFKEDKFASQWGSIRNLASIASRFSPTGKDDNLYDALFKEKTGYLVHGVAKEKWEKKNRIGEFKEFIETLDRDTTLSESEKLTAVINLAAEMAKKSR